MQLIRIKDGYLPNCYPAQINKETLSYFIGGQGWQKTKKFRIVEEVTLPEPSAKITWLQVAQLFDQYGIEVAVTYANHKTAGIVSRQTARGYGLIYARIKHLMPANFDPSFFEAIKCDYMLSCFGMFILDIVATDKSLSSIDNEYNSTDPTDSTYHGKPCSMSDYVIEKYGQQYDDILNELIKDVVFNGTQEQASDIEAAIAA